MQEEVVTRFAAADHKSYSLPSVVCLVPNHSAATQREVAATATLSPNRWGE
jgi:hypothetical protein